MDLFSVLSVLISLSAFFSFLNYRYFRLPRTIGLMLSALVLSVALIAASRLGWDIKQEASDLITLGLVMGGYELAHALHTSGPLAMVAAGLLIGNQGRAFAMSDETRRNLDTFWELVDEILNALLFVLIGIEFLVLDISFPYVLAGLLAIPLVLLVRLLSVGIPFGLVKGKMPFGIRYTMIFPKCPFLLVRPFPIGELGPIWFWMASSMGVLMLPCSL
jgi:NhaP-type Na+/H+ or K+/H+ antiporter